MSKPAPADQPGEPLPDAGRPEKWSLRGIQVWGRFIALVVVFLFFAVLVEDGKFYTARTLENMLRLSAVYATASLGMTLVIIAAGIDLSVGSIIALTVVVVAWVLDLHYVVVPLGGGPPESFYLIHQYPILLPILAVLAAVTVATLAGFCNGAMIVYLRLVPFIVTLGTMGIFRGLAKGLAGKGGAIYPGDTWVGELMSPRLTTWINWVLGRAKRPPSGLDWFVLPPGVWLLLVAAVGAALLLRYTRLGRHIFAVGSNEETARLCGVPVGRTKIIVYALAGFFCGLAGLMQFSFIEGMGQSTTAVSYELFVIAAVVIGGGSLMGGEGSILGSVMGALIITMLHMGGQLMGWEQWIQDIMIGAIIIAAVTLNQLRYRRPR
jgi:ribose transport system permease protein/erythritol transport system permease protein